MVISLWNQNDTISDLIECWLCVNQLIVVFFHHWNVYDTQTRYSHGVKTGFFCIGDHLKETENKNKNDFIIWQFKSWLVIRLPNII